MNTKQFLQDIHALYEEVRVTYLPLIDETKKTSKIGGSYYGRSELISTSGTHYKTVIGYTDPSNGYSLSTYYDFVFQVGGEHAGVFLPIRKDFIALFQSKLDNILMIHGFVDRKQLIEDDNYTVYFIPEVSYGTNFSTYCGISIDIQKPGEFQSYHYNAKSIKDAIAEKGALK